MTPGTTPPTTSLTWPTRPSGGAGHAVQRRQFALIGHRAEATCSPAGARQCDVITMPSLWLGSWPGARPVPRVCRLVARLWCAALVYTWLAQRLERRPHLGGKEVGLFPGGEVAASVELVVVDE